MFKLFVRRILLLFPQIIILSFIVFFLSNAVDPLTWTSEGRTTMADASAFNPEGTLSIFVSYWNWLVGIVTRGDFGWSWRLRMPAIEAIGLRLPNTLRLAVVTLFLVYGVGILLGIISGRRVGTWKDRTIQIVTLMGSSLPSFTLALLLLLFLGFRLRWFPTSGSLPPGTDRTVVGFVAYQMRRLQHLVLPALSLAIIQIIQPMKYLRSGIIDTEGQKFVAMARAKGASETYIFRKHIFKNSLTSLIGSFPMQIAAVVTGSIIIESIFNFPGLGELFFSAFAGTDTALINSLILVFGLLILLGGFISDVLLMAVDPRIKIKE